MPDLVDILCDIAKHLLWLQDAESLEAKYLSPDQLKQHIRTLEAYREAIDGNSHQAAL